jgi:hypothetical protein
LFAPNAGQHLRDEQRRRRSQFDRGTSLAEREEYGYDDGFMHSSYQGYLQCEFMSGHLPIYNLTYVETKNGILVIFDQFGESFSPFGAENHGFLPAQSCKLWSFLKSWPELNNTCGQFGEVVGIFHWDFNGLAF